MGWKINFYVLVSNQWLPYDSILIHIGAPTEVSSLFEGSASRDSMLSAFRMGPAASERGFCDIDRVYIQSYEIMCRKILTRQKYIDKLAFSIWIISDVFSPCQDFPFFDTWFRISEYNSIDTVHVRLLPDPYEIPKT